MQQDTVGTLIGAMATEIACFEAYIASQRAFNSALRDRDWVALQTAMELLDEISSSLAERESARAEAFERLRAELNCEASGLYRLALLVAEPSRSELTDLYRRLKIAAMRAKFENASASDFAAGNRDLLRAVLEELFPEKRGRIYGRSGRTVQPGLDSLVLNTAL
ncbi:MAG TPA: flagellar export chaperone FlgN [Rectinemataceae bacterium]|nr:flagellar export chaperone FlgN [Rectinemataceae bacterium]